WEGVRAHGAFVGWGRCSVAGDLEHTAVFPRTASAGIVGEWQPWYTRFVLLYLGWVPAGVPFRSSAPGGADVGSPVRGRRFGGQLWPRAEYGDDDRNHPPLPPGHRFAPVRPAQRWHAASRRRALGVSAYAGVDGRSSTRTP